MENNTIEEHSRELKKELKILSSKISKELRNTGTSFKSWLSNFIKIERLLIPLSIEKFYMNDNEASFEIFIFGFLIFTLRRY